MIDEILARALVIVRRTQSTVHRERGAVPVDSIRVRVSPHASDERVLQFRCDEPMVAPTLFCLHSPLRSHPFLDYRFLLDTDEQQKHLVLDAGRGWVFTDLFNTTVSAVRDERTMGEGRFV